MYQAPRGAKGSFEILPDTGDILLRGFAAADESTGAHEFGHAVRRMLLNRDVPAENRVGVSDEDIAIAEEWAGAKNGVWDTAAEEKFARGLERYLRDGRAPTPILQPVFDKFAEWLGRIYRNVTGSPIDVEISDAMREVFGKLLTRGLPQAAPQEAPQAAPQPQAPQPGEARAPPTASQPLETPEDESLVGMRNASTDTRRARVNLPPRAAPIRLSNQEAWDTALDRLADNENAGFNLVAELTAAPRSIDPVETALYTHELLTREHALDRALDRYNTNPNKSNFEAMQAASAAVAEAILTAERIGTIEGRALQARKILVHQDFTLARAVAMATAANGGQQLNAAQLQEVTELHKQLQDLQTKLEAANAEIAKQEAEKVFSVEVTFKKELKQAKARGEKPLSWIEKKADEARARMLARKREGRLNSLPVDEFADLAIIGVSYIAKGINKVGDFTAQLVKDFGKKYLPFAADVFAKSQEMYSSAAPSAKIKSRETIFEGLSAEAPLNDKAIFELVRYYINEGVQGFEPVMGAVLQGLRQFYPDLTLRDVHDAYSKYGQTRTPSKDDDLKTAREYRELSRLQSQLEDVLSGKAPKRTGLIRDNPTKDVRDLTKQVKDAMRRLKIRPTSDSQQLRSSFDAIKTRLRNDYEDFDVAIRKGEAKKERSPQTFTAEEQAELDRLRQMRDDRKDDYEAVFGTKTLPEEEVRRRALALIDRRIDEERQMLRDGILKRMRDFKMGPWSPEMATKKKILDQLKADRRERQNAARPKKPEDIKKYERDLASLERRIKEEEALLAAGLAARQKEFQMGRWSPQLAELQARLDELRDKRREFAKSLEPEKDLAKIEYDRAMKVLENTIQRYKDVIAGVEKPGAGRNYTVDAAMQALIDTRDALRDAAEAVRDADPARRDKRKQAVLKQLEKGIAETTRKIQDGDLSTKVKNDPFGSDPDVAKLREVRDSLNKTLAVMRRNALPKRSPEEIRASRDRKMLETKIAKLRERIEANDYSKPVKLPPPDYRERNALLKEKNDLQAKFNEGLLALQLAQRSAGKKFLDNTMDVVFGVSRAMLTSFDAGAFGRQAGLVNFMRPGLALKNFPANFAFSEKAAGRYESELEAHPDYARAVAAKLSLTSWRPGSSLSDMEEVYRSRIAKKIPGVAASERAYVTYLNVVRFTYFNALVNSLPVVEQTEANLKALARHVNVMTGRGDLGKFEAAAATLAAVFFSPKYWWSRLQVLGNMIYVPLDAATGFRLGPKETQAARKIVAVEYARLVGVTGLVFSLFAFAKDAFDLDDEEFMIGTDPRSSDFGKLRMGNTRIDFMAGLLQNIVFLTRMATGEKVTAGGEVKALSGEEAGFKEARLGETIRLLRTKLSPAAGSIANALDGQDVVGNKFTPETEVLGSYIPMSAAELYGSIRELGVSAGVAAGLLNFIGIGASTYGGEEDYVIEQDIMTGVFMVDQSRYDAEEKEKTFKLTPAKF